MDLLLYFGSYAAVITLFMSGSIVVAWVVFRTIRAGVRFVRVLINPQIEEDATQRVPPDYQLAHLKRAGQ